MIAPSRKAGLLEQGLTRRSFLAAGVGLGIAEIAGCGPSLGPTEVASFAQGKRPSSVMDLSATEAIRRMKAGELSAESYAEALLKRADEEARLNAFISLDRSRILEAARRLDVLRGKGRTEGVLYGLPVSVKDVIN